ncbi:hypothetical protein Rs2_35799 [Raphanus sativus]|nr:hypothetical protein Rs2_35799 [Raphanus sativus]
MARREWRRPDSPPKGLYSLEGGCIAETGMIEACNGGAWPDMIQEAQDLVRSSLRDTGPWRKGQIIVELIHPYGMVIRCYTATSDSWWFRVNLIYGFALPMASGRGNEVMESYGMIGINLGLVQDWLRAMKKSKTDQELVGIVNLILCCSDMEVLNHGVAGSEKSLHGLGWAGIMGSWTSGWGARQSYLTARSAGRELGTSSEVVQLS